MKPTHNRAPRSHRDPPDRPYDPSTLDDRPYGRPLPPSQPQGWADPDPLYVEPKEVDPRVPYSGWESMRHRWDEAGNDPISHRTALIGFVVCALVIAIIVIYLAAPRGAADRMELGSGSAATHSRFVEYQPLLGASQAIPAVDRDSLLGDIGGAPPPGAAANRYGAQATWCKPTATHCQSWGGDDARLAAVYSFRFGDEPYWVRVWRGDDHTDALVVSHCACQNRHDRIDLSVAAFRELAATRLGRIAVEVETLAWPYEPGGDPPPHPDDDRLRIEDGGPGPTVPPTDTTP